MKAFLGGFGQTFVIGRINGTNVAFGVDVQTDWLGYRFGKEIAEVLSSQFFVKAFSDARDVVFDPFMGSGTTMAAAALLDRTGYGCEISPAYCDVIVQRWEKFTGRKAERFSCRRDAPRRRGGVQGGIVMCVASG
ncbi:MAG: site-specific DNA-methyltransferase, partial [Bacteroidia bacterium]|nr:site-specific DNA-methyltransferase [Bacteroidia bacterium]